MPSKNKVIATISNSDNLTANIIGGNKGAAHQAGEDVANEVNANIQSVNNSKVNVIGGDISHSDKDLEPLLSELVEILSEHLTEKGQKEDLQEVASEVLEQANKPPDEKNISKIQRLLNSLGGYVGLTTLAVTQAERIKALFESIQKLILGH